MINKAINLKSYAKINLHLDIGEKLNNGYHYIETIFQTINLFDEIYLKKLDKPIVQLKCNHPEVPVKEDSIMYKAIKSIIKDRNMGLAVSIYKNIPLASGLGGGSSNIATILLGICKLFHLKISLSQLTVLVSQFGMDIPFFIRRGTVYARGRGEILFPLIPIDPPIHLVLINPGRKISTKWAYQIFDEEPTEVLKKPHLSIDSFLNQKKAIQLNDIQEITYNHFEKLLSKRYPFINQMINKLKQEGAVVASLSGSGPTVYGVFENKLKADKAYLKIKDNYPFVYKTNTVRADNIILEN